MENKRVTIGNIDIGDGLPCFLVAEIALNHNGSMTLAHRLIEAAAVSGASMVKFQKRSPADLATTDFLDGPFTKCPLFGRTERDVRNQLELRVEQLKELRDRARELGMVFFLSVFDLPSLQVALELDLPVLKISSHSITNAPLLQAVAETKIPTVASMGAATWEERDKAFEILQDSPLVILHCVSAYPCPDSLIKLDTIVKLRQRYRRVVGYSGHELGIDVSVAAALLGAALIERHFTLNRSMVGIDHAISIDPDEFGEMVRRIRCLEKVRGVVTEIAEEELPSRRNYHVAVCAKRRITAGGVIKSSDLVCKQPLGDEGIFFTGFEIQSLIGKRAICELGADQPIPRNAVN